jgi:hypothetical protein
MYLLIKCGSSYFCCCKVEAGLHLLDLKNVWYFGFDTCALFLCALVSSCSETDMYACRGWWYVFGE